MTGASPEAGGELAALRAGFPRWGILQISPEWFVAVRGKTTVFSAATPERIHELLTQWEESGWKARS